MLGSEDPVPSLESGASGGTVDWQGCVSTGMDSFSTSSKLFYAEKNYSMIKRVRMVCVLEW